MRKFRYVRIPVMDSNCKLPKNYWSGVARLEIDNFDKYLGGSYFPPIKALPCKEVDPHPVFGTQFGIFAI